MSNEQHITITSNGIVTRCTCANPCCKRQAFGIEDFMKAENLMVSKNEADLAVNLDTIASKIDSRELSEEEAISEANKVLNAYTLQSNVGAEAKRKEILRQAAFTFMKSHFKKKFIKFFIAVVVVILAFLYRAINHA